MKICDLKDVQELDAICNIWKEQVENFRDKKEEFKDVALVQLEKDLGYVRKGIDDAGPYFIPACYKDDQGNPLAILDLWPYPGFCLLAQSSQ